MSYFTKKQLINEAINRGKCSQGKFSTFIITGDWQEREMGGEHSNTGGKLHTSKRREFNSGEPRESLTRRRGM